MFRNRIVRCKSGIKRMGSCGRGQEIGVEITKRFNLRAIFFRMMFAIGDFNKMNASETVEESIKLGIFFGGKKKAFGSEIDVNVLDVVGFVLDEQEQRFIGRGILL